MVFKRCTEYDYGDPIHQLFAPAAYCCARGSAAAIMVSSAVVLVPMCRTFLTWVRNNGPRSFPWDNAIEFHKFVAIVIFIATCVHIGGHSHNYYRVMTADWETEIKPILGPTDFCKTDIKGKKRCGSGA